MFDVLIQLTPLIVCIQGFQLLVIPTIFNILPHNVQQRIRFKLAVHLLPNIKHRQSASYKIVVQPIHTDQFMCSLYETLMQFRGLHTIHNFQLGLPLDFRRGHPYYPVTSPHHNLMHLLNIERLLAPIPFSYKEFCHSSPPSSFTNTNEYLDCRFILIISILTSALAAAMCPSIVASPLRRYSLSLRSTPTYRIHLTTCFCQLRCSTNSSSTPSS